LIASSWILGEISDGSCAGYLATGWKGFTSQALCKGRFSGAISAYEADPVTAVDSDRDILN
jgi:hypothetical protein